MSFILIAIDGTSSATGYNTTYETENGIATNVSFVRQFYDAASIGAKRFWEGPQNAATGTDSGGILESAWTFLAGRLSVFPESKVVLVGHSRGGHMVTALAIRLGKYSVGDFQSKMTMPGGQTTNPPQLVHFLRLYDAVDRTYSIGGDTEVVPPNVVNFAHAIRSPWVGSRTTFGNTATRANKSNVHLSNYSVTPFSATHGAIGGAVPHRCPSTVEFASQFSSIGVAKAIATQEAIAPMLDDFCHLGLAQSQNTQASKAANAYILAEARRARVPI